MVRTWWWDHKTRENKQGEKEFVASGCCECKCLSRTKMAATPTHKEKGNRFSKWIKYTEEKWWICVKFSSQIQKMKNEIFLVFKIFLLTVFFFQILKQQKSQLRLIKAASVRLSNFRLTKIILGEKLWKGSLFVRPSTNSNPCTCITCFPLNQSPSSDSHQSTNQYHHVTQMRRLRLAISDVFATFSDKNRRYSHTKNDSRPGRHVSMAQLHDFRRFRKFSIVFQAFSGSVEGRGLSLSLQPNGSRLADWYVDHQYPVDHRGGRTWWAARLDIVICYQLGSISCWFPPPSIHPQKKEEEEEKEKTTRISEKFTVLPFPPPLFFLCWQRKKIQLKSFG